MTVTREQAAYLAPIIAACRPHGARRWQHSEITAAIVKLGHLGLADVILAAVRCAQDRYAESPFAITNLASPHWRERQGSGPVSVVKRSPADFCGDCGQPLDAHPPSDHEPVRYERTDAPKAADWAAYAREAVAESKAIPAVVAGTEATEESETA